jgi:hypothetical protein
VENFELRRALRRQGATGSFPLKAGQHFSQADFSRWPGQPVSPTGTTQAAEQLAATKRGEHLLQIAVWNRLAVGDLRDPQDLSCGVGTSQFHQGHEAILGFGTKGHWLSGEWLGWILADPELPFLTTVSRPM